MTRSRRLATIAAFAFAFALGGAGLVTVTSAALTSAHAATATCRAGAADFDQNGGTDVAIGAQGTPVANVDGSGVVDVRMKFADTTRTVLIPNPDSGSTDGFGASVAELDLAGDTGRKDLCSVLAVSAVSGFPPSGCENCPGYGSRVFLYRWDAATSNFVLLSEILAEDIFPDGGTGTELAAQTMTSTAPADRQPVLWIGAAYAGHRNRGYNAGEVARVVLDPDGSVASEQTFAPGATRTAQVPLTETESGSFGFSLQGTPSADQVIVGAPDTTVAGHPSAGAVVVLNRGARSQLLTENTAGVPGTAEDRDLFGSSVWLSTEASAAAGTSTSLLVGSPGESIGNAKHAGAAAQLRYNRAVSPAAVARTGAKFWSQGTAGVSGTPESGDHFGSSFESLTTHGSGAPRILVGVPDEDLADHHDAGSVVVLGDGRSYDEASGTGTSVHTGARYGATLAAWRNTDDNLDSDPVPSPPVGEWSRYVIVSAPGDHALAFGLPAGTVHSSRLLRPQDFCRLVGHSVRCAGASAVTSSGGG